MERMQHLQAGLAREIARKLAELQADRTDAEFADLLGVSRPHWHHIRSGKRQPSYTILKRAIAHFPELYPIVMRDLVAEPVQAAS